MTTFASSPEADNAMPGSGASDGDGKSEPAPSGRRFLKIRRRRGDQPHRRHAVEASEPQLTPPPQGALPPIAVLLARPVLLAICVILGGIAGFASWGGRGYQATATVEFTSEGNDTALVQLEGQSLAQKITTEPVLQRAATAISQPLSDIADHTTANWQPQSLMVGVTVVATGADEAVARANAVAQAAVGIINDEANQRLDAASTNANALLIDQGLTDPGAEAARRAELGSSLGQRQEALSAQSQSVFISKAADDATPAGLTRTLATAIGLAAGLFAGCLIAVMLGARGLRAWSLTEIRRLAPGAEVLTPSEAPQVAARMVEADESYLAIVVTRRAHDVAEEFIANIERILAAHGKTVTVARPATKIDDTSAPLLRFDAPDNVPALVGTDVLVVILDAGTESAAMLEGQSGFRTVIAMRRFWTPISDGLSATRVYGRATPMLMLGK